LYIKKATKDKQMMLKDLVKCNIIYNTVSESQYFIPITSKIDMPKIGALSLPRP
jgi:hypothetical protein